MEFLNFKGPCLILILEGDKRSATRTYPLGIVTWFDDSYNRTYLLVHCFKIKAKSLIQEAETAIRQDFIQYGIPPLSVEYCPNGVRAYEIPLHHS